LENLLDSLCSQLTNSHFALLYAALVASAGTQYPFRAYFANRIWNGNIYYQTNDRKIADINGQETVVVNDGANTMYNGFSYGAVTRPPSFN
jgi:hypothetical protein